MRLTVGTSGFSYAEWRGTVYPEKLPEARMLSFYGERLPSVEVNNTFYRMPEASVLSRWAQSVPDSFTFAVKAPRRITHLSKLKNVEAVLTEFLGVARVLEQKLGPVLVQLPPTLRRDDGVLSDFLALCPPDARFAFEFRHDSWFHDDVYARLAERGAAWCATEVDADEGLSAPFVRTAPFAYVRLRRATYDEAELVRALERIRGLNVDEAFVYFKHEVLGPGYAERLRALQGANSSKARPLRSVKPPDASQPIRGRGRQASGSGKRPRAR